MLTVQRLYGHSSFHGAEWQSEGETMLKQLQCLWLLSAVDQFLCGPFAGQKCAYSVAGFGQHSANGG